VNGGKVVCAKGAHSKRQKRKGVAWELFVRRTGYRWGKKKRCKMSVPIQASGGRKKTD